MRFPLFFAAVAVCTVAITVGGCAIVVVSDDGNVHASGNSTVRGDGQYTTENRTVGAIDRLELQGSVQMEVRVGAAPSLRVEADGNLLPLVRTDTVDGTLTVWLASGFHSDTPVRVLLTTPQLTQIHASGSGRLTVSGLHGAPLRVELDGSRKTVLAGTVGPLSIRQQGSGGIDATALVSGSTDAGVFGSGRLELGQVVGQQLRLEMQGSGGVRASGTVQAVRVSMHGSGSAELIGLRSQTADLQTQGSGDMVVTVLGTLLADSNGSGHITVHGEPDQRGVQGRNVRIVP